MWYIACPSIIRVYLCMKLWLTRQSWTTEFTPCAQFGAIVYNNSEIVWRHVANILEIYDYLLLHGARYILPLPHVMWAHCVKMSHHTQHRKYITCLLLSKEDQATAIGNVQKIWWNLKLWFFYTWADRHTDMLIAIFNTHALGEVTRGQPVECIHCHSIANCQQSTNPTLPQSNLKNLVRCSLVHSLPICQISWKSTCNVLSYTVHKHRQMAMIVVSLPTVVELVIKTTVVGVLIVLLHSFLQRAAMLALQCPHCKRCTSYSNSVCLSVCSSHMPVLYQNDGT